MSECKSVILIYNIPLKVFMRWRKVLLCKKSPLSVTLRPCFIILIPFLKVLSKLLYYPWTKMKTNHNKMRESFLDSISVNYYIIYLFPYLQISHKYITHTVSPHPFLYPQQCGFFLIYFPEMFPTPFHQWLYNPSTLNFHCLGLDERLFALDTADLSLYLEVIHWPSELPQIAGFLNFTLFLRLFLLFLYCSC